MSDTTSTSDIINVFLLMWFYTTAGIGLFALIAITLAAISSRRSNHHHKTSWPRTFNAHYNPQGETTYTGEFDSDELAEHSSVYRRWGLMN